MPTVRDALPGDLASIREIADAHEVRPSWPVAGPDFLDLERDAGRLLVAVGVAGRVEGFAGTLRRGGLTHLGDLFVAAGAQSGGHGGRLLAAILPPAADVVTYASSDPRAQALYLRNGLVPGQPLWYLRGSPRVPVEAAADLRPATAEDVVSLDAALSGGPRPAHLAWYAAQVGVAVWSAAGGYAFTRVVDGLCQIGPAGGRDGDASTRTILAAVRWATLAGLDVSLAVFGAHPVALALVRAGCRIEDQDLLMASRPGLFDAERYLPHADLG